MKKIVAICCSFFLIACSKGVEKIEIARLEGGHVSNLTIEEFDAKIKSEENFVSFVTVEGLADCGCSDTENILTSYAVKHNFEIYRVSLDMEKADYKIRYELLLNVTAEDGENLLPELGDDGNGGIVTPIMPRLLVYSLGYLAVNTDKNFESKLNTYIKVV